MSLWGLLFWSFISGMIVGIIDAVRQDTNWRRLLGGT